jgi:hypothetical protein
MQAEEAAMQAGEPSHTALGAAGYRAIHQTLEGGAIFSDPFAVRILDDETRARLDKIAADPSLRPMRLVIAARSRFSEDALAACVARGVRQVVVLGAGLDTFSLRNPHAGLGVRVFEVDYPATQQWKRERLNEAGLAIPGSLTFAPVDFERQSLADGLEAADFDADRPAFPTPSLGGRSSNASGASRGEGANVCSEFERLSKATRSNTWSSPMCKCTSGMRHLAQARNPYSLSWLWIPGSRFARPGMTGSGLLRGACHQARIRTTVRSQ